MRRFLTFFSLLFFASSFALHGADAKPNVVVILADDLGYGDVQCYNPERGKIPTPHIDQLAAEGMRFTDGHSSSGVCSPSRYTLLTGRYHWRTTLQSGIVGQWGKPLIAPDRLTIAGLAKQQGYRTACVDLSRRGYRTSEPGGIARETSPLLATVFAALRAEGITPADIARDLHITVAELNRHVFGLIPTAIDGSSTPTPPRRPRLTLVDRL